MVNLFGNGFIGSNFSKRYVCTINDRNDLVPKTNEILYLISTTDNYNLKTNPYIDIETNLITLIRVLENCKYLNNVTFNFASSWFVYGNAGDNVTEEEVCNPEGFYSITKHTAERLLETYCKEFGINYRILRFANVIGPGDKSVSPKKNVLSFLTRRLLNNEPITIQHNGDFYRDYIHVNDVCDAVNTIIRKGKLNEIYNIGNALIRFGDAIEYIVDKTHSSSKITYSCDDHSSKPYSTIMNCDKLRALGFHCKYDTKAILDELIEIERTRN